MLLSELYVITVLHCTFRNPNLFPNGSWIRSFYWPVYSRTFKEYLTLNPKNKTRGYGLSSRKCAFWNKYLPSLLGKRKKKKNFDQSS